MFVLICSVGCKHCLLLTNAKEEKRKLQLGSKMASKLPFFFLRHVMCLGCCIVRESIKKILKNLEFSVLLPFCMFLKYNKNCLVVAAIL